MAPRTRTSWSVLPLVTLCIVVFSSLLPDVHRSTFKAPRAFVGLSGCCGYKARKRGLQGRVACQVHHTYAEPEWFELTNGPDIEHSGNGTVLPVFPLRTITWPGGNVDLKVIEPAHRHLYDDLLMSGQRAVIAPLALLPACGFVQNDTPPEERRVHVVASVLRLEEIKEVSADTGDAVKYIAKHSVVGRARITKLLNPSALFEVSEDGVKTKYLQAEVEFLRDNEPAINRAAMDDAAFQELASTWETLRAHSETLDEPRLSSKEVVQNRVFSTSTWQLLDLWQKLQACTRHYRDKACAAGAVRDWVEAQQQMGKLPAELPKEVDAQQIGMPQALRDAVARARDARAVQLGDDFWTPMLGCLAADDYAARAALLTQMAAREVRIAQTRISLRKLLG